MSPKTEIEEAALALETDSRARLAVLLLDSLDEEPEELDAKTAESLWLAEAEERCLQIDAGEVELLALDDVMQELRLDR